MTAPLTTAEHRETARQAADRLSRLLERNDWRTASRSYIEGARNALANAADEIDRLLAADAPASGGMQSVPRQPSAKQINELAEQWGYTTDEAADYWQIALEVFRPAPASGVTEEQSDLHHEATATVASIRTRLGQIEKACSTWTADSIYQIERATGALRIAALDLHNVLQRKPLIRGERGDG